MQRYLHLVLLSLSLILTSCSQSEQKQPLRIATNPWLGYTPIAYAQDKGWLKEADVKIIWASGLSESVKLFERGLIDGFTVTQYEYLSLEQKKELSVHYLFNMSNGADLILSNRQPQELQQAQSIDVYLEVSTLNKDILDAFVNKYQLGEKEFNLINYEPIAMTEVKATQKPTLLIAYEPYATSIARNGFSPISSTRDLTSLMIIDALYLPKTAALSHAEDIKIFSQACDRAIANLKNDPKEFYQVVQGYLDGQSYTEFTQSLEGIQWLNMEHKENAFKYLRSISVPVQKRAP